MAAVQSAPGTNKPCLGQLSNFLLDYVIATGGTHGMTECAAKHFGCGRGSIRRRMRHLRVEYAKREAERGEGHPLNEER